MLCVRIVQVLGEVERDKVVGRAVGNVFTLSSHIGSKEVCTEAHYISSDDFWVRFDFNLGDSWEADGGRVSDETLVTLQRCQWAALRLGRSWWGSPCHLIWTTSVLSQGTGSSKCNYKYKFPKRGLLKIKYKFTICGPKVQVFAKTNTHRIKQSVGPCKYRHKRWDACLCTWKHKFTRCGPLEAWRKAGTLDWKRLRLLVHGEDLLRFARWGLFDSPDLVQLYIP